MYNYFVVDDESNKYRLSVSSFDYAQSTPAVGDGMTGRNNQRFSTANEDNDATAQRDCADLVGGGFWYGPCLINDMSVTAPGNSFGWKSVFGTYLLQEAEMYACP